jgi:hypothetical protein
MRIIALITMLLAVCAARAVDLKELTPWEEARWKLAKDDPKLAAGFHATRDYVHLCRRIAEGKASPANLHRPNEFDTRFLEAGDVATINKAIDMGLDALADQLVRETPATAVPALAPKDMTPWEAARWAEAKDNATAKEAFLATRGYVRFAMGVLNGTKHASELKRPKAFDAKYLAEGDVAIINKAIDKGLDELMKP